MFDQTSLFFQRSKVIAEEFLQTTVIVSYPKPSYIKMHDWFKIQNLNHPEPVENQLNTSYQQDLKNEQDSFNYFMS